MHISKSLSVTALLVIAAANSMACGGDDDEEENSASGAVSSCRSMCAVQYQDCPGEVDFCNQLCDAVVPSLSASCQATANAYYQCGAGVEWTCQSIFAMRVDSNLCATEEEAYNACL